MEEPDPWSAPTPALYERMRERVDTGDAAVVSVVNVAGSAYRRPGAKMVVTPGGDALGAITAGCLEKPVVEVAKSVLETGTLHVETYDLMDDDVWGMGMGCNGVIDVLVEPLDASWREPLDALARGGSVAVLTVVRSDGETPVGARAAVDPDGTVRAAEGRDPLPEALADRVDAASFAEAGRSGTVELDTDDGTVELFVDGLTPPPRLLVFGAQHDVVPVARFARDAGFRVTVATGRGARADPGRFPAAHRVTSTRPSELDGLLDVPEHTYAVLMSHNFVDDRLAVETLLDASVPYVGLMGPRKRFERMREEFAEDGEPLSADQLDRLATPVGLNLGGGEPAQIALSIVGEALAVANGQAGGRLTDHEGPIHPRKSVQR